MGKSGLDEDSGLMISVWGTRTKCCRCCVLAGVWCSPWSVLGHSLSSLLSGGSHQGSPGPTTETPWHLPRAKKGEGKGEKNKKRKGTKKEQKKRNRKEKERWEFADEALDAGPYRALSLFSGSWKDSLHKLLPPNCDFLVGSKWCTKVSERGLAVPHVRAIKPPKLGLHAFISKCSCGFHLKSCAWSSGEVITNPTFLAAEGPLWVCGCCCVGVSVLGCTRAGPAGRALSRLQALCPRQLLMELKFWNYGPDSPLAPVGVPPLLGAVGQLGFLAVCPDLPWHSCPGVLQSLGLFMCEHWCWWQGWVMELFSFRVLESTIWVGAQPEQSCR